MSNLSFARIMYGTNESISTTARMSASGLSSVSNGANALNAAGNGQPSLQDLLHKAWLVLCSKS